MFALASAARISLPAALLQRRPGYTSVAFALDGIALALLAATFGAARAPRWLVIALTAWGVLVGAWGLHWFAGNFLH